MSVAKIGYIWDETHRNDGASDGANIDTRNVKQYTIKTAIMCENNDNAGNKRHYMQQQRMNFCEKYQK